MDDRRNINRGFKKLQVWNDAIELYILVCKTLMNTPFEFKKTVSNAIDAAQSISRNIAEGYCRKSIREYLQFLYYALGSCGELHSCLFSMAKAEHITVEDFNTIDELQYKTENRLIQLTKSMQRKMKNKDWNDTL